MSKKLAWTLFQYGLAFSLLGLVIWMNWDPGSRTGLQHVWHNRILKGNLNYGYLGLAFVLLAISLSITLIRWYILVRTVDLPFRVRDAFRLGMIGFFFNAFLPGSVGGDVIKAAGLAREQSRRTVAVATVIMDRVIALWALIWFVMITGGIFWWQGLLEGPAAATGYFVVKAAAIVVAITFSIWLAMGLLGDQRAEAFAQWLSRIPKVGGSLGELWRAGWTYRRRQASVYLVMLISWIGHIGFVFVFYCSVRTLWEPGSGPIPTVAQHFLLVPIGLVIQAAPLFPGGAGIGEAGFGGLYTWFGCIAAFAVLGSLVMRILNWVIGFSGYFVYLSIRSQLAIQQQKEEQSSEEKLVATGAPSATVT